MGGLGNQMFQYAAGLRLADKLGVPLALDLSWLESEGLNADAVREYELNRLKVQENFLPQPKRRFGLGRQPRLSPYEEKAFAFDSKSLNQPDNTLLVGYWQSEKYFKGIEARIRQEFEPKNSAAGANLEVLRQINEAQSVSLHVRRGDYVSVRGANKFHGVVPLSYYQQAVKEITKVVARPTFFIISDDPQWCRQNLKLPVETVLIDHNPADQGHEDMRLMSACQHHIIANSSFSWWGAWLNPKKDKKVIAPLQWFKDENMDTRDLIPEDWIRL